MTDHIYGPNGHIVDAFIEHLKGRTKEQWEGAGDAALGATLAASWDAARYADWDAAGLAAAGDAARAAVAEIQGADLMRARNQPFFFLPMFGFADEQAVLKGQN